METTMFRKGPGPRAAWRTQYSEMTEPKRKTADFHLLHFRGMWSDFQFTQMNSPFDYNGYLAVGSWKCRKMRDADIAGSQIVWIGHSTALLCWLQFNQALFLNVSSLISLLLKSSYNGNEKQWRMRANALLIKGIGLCEDIKRMFPVASEVF